MKVRESSSRKCDGMLAMQDSLVLLALPVAQVDEVERIGLSFRFVCSLSHIHIPRTHWTTV